MLDPTLQYLGLHLAHGLPLDDSLLPVLRVGLPLVLSAILAGLFIAHRMVGRGGADLQAGCRRHEWLEIEGHFICLHCNCEAGSARIMGTGKR